MELLLRLKTPQRSHHLSAFGLLLWLQQSCVVITSKMITSFVPWQIAFLILLLERSISKLSFGAPWKHSTEVWMVPMDSPCLAYLGHPSFFLSPWACRHSNTMPTHGVTRQLCKVPATPCTLWLSLPWHSPWLSSTPTSSRAHLDSLGKTVWWVSWHFFWEV